jgi:hypothetical protein
MLQVGATGMEEEEDKNCSTTAEARSLTERGIL